MGAEGFRHPDTGFVDFLNIVFYDITEKGHKLPKARLTSSFVKQSVCPPEARRIDYFDADIPGFMLEVRASGGKTFYQRYRDSRGKERQFKIGSADILAVRQASAKARQILAEALLGSDPQQQREILREIPTLTRFVRDTYLPFAQNTKRSWRTDETVLRIHILPKIGHLSLDQITTQDVASILRQMKEGSYASGTTNRVLILLRFVFNCARRWAVPGSEKIRQTD